ncbi:DUF3164 family protein [Sphingomonas endophytica]|uniref:Sulfate transporter n=1 Tax=Sphingomonas endophytica TaxID=869719 RepID=A0A147I3Q5_9SPHN|nr:DUF3164 family protein [Sphingomonas endophytica]KTT72629.1 sulfate transporter [Sphingomonas endophytica]
MTEAVRPGAIDVGGKPYLRDAKGALVPLEAIKAVDLLMDETVRDIIARATEVSAAIAAFKVEAFAAVGGFQALLAQEYGTTIGGPKGNVTLTSFDGCLKVQVQAADLLELGPELQTAKTLIDGCLSEWAAGSGAELRALVNQVFSVDKEGQINRAALFMLLRVESPDERWQRAMEAIRNSIRVIGSRSYVRFYNRAAPDAAWQGIPLDIAVA